jgi:hypothetical protein
MLLVLASVSWARTSLFLRETLADWIKNTFYFDTAAVSVFVTVETPLLKFFPW